MSQTPETTLAKNSGTLFYSPCSHRSWLVNPARQSLTPAPFPPFHYNDRAIREDDGKSRRNTPAAQGTAYAGTGTSAGAGSSNFRSSGHKQRRWTQIVTTCSKEHVTCCKETNCKGPAEKMGKGSCRSIWQTLQGQENSFARSPEQNHCRSEG